MKLIKFAVLGMVTLFSAIGEGERFELVKDGITYTGPSELQAQLMPAIEEINKPNMMLLLAFKEQFLEHFKKELVVNAKVFLKIKLALCCMDQVDDEASLSKAMQVEMSKLHHTYARIEAWAEAAKAVKRVNFWQPSEINGPKGTTRTNLVWYEETGKYHFMPQVKLPQSARGPITALEVPITCFNETNVYDSQVFMKVFCDQLVQYWVNVTKDRFEPLYKDFEERLNVGLAESNIFTKEPWLRSQLAKAGRMFTYVLVTNVEKMRVPGVGTYEYTFNPHLVLEQLKSAPIELIEDSRTDEATTSFEVVKASAMLDILMDQLMQNDSKIVEILEGVKLVPAHEQRAHFESLVEVYAGFNLKERLKAYMTKEAEEERELYLRQRGVFPSEIDVQPRVLKELSGCVVTEMPDNLSKAQLAQVEKLAAEIAKVTSYAGKNTFKEKLNIQKSVGCINGLTGLKFTKDDLAGLAEVEEMIERFPRKHQMTSIKGKVRLQVWGLEDVKKRLSAGQLIENVELAQTPGTVDFNFVEIGHRDEGRGSLFSVVIKEDEAQDLVALYQQLLTDVSEAENYNRARVINNYFNTVCRSVEQTLMTHMQTESTRKFISSGIPAYIALKMVEEEFGYLWMELAGQNLMMAENPDPTLKPEALLNWEVGVIQDIGNIKEDLKSGAEKQKYAMAYQVISGMNEKHGADFIAKWLKSTIESKNGAKVSVSDFYKQYAVLSGETIEGAIERTFK